MSKPPRTKKPRVHDLVRRQRALEATKARFAGKPFVLGASDCAKLTLRHLRAMGHTRLPPAGNYRSAAQALAALRRACKWAGAAETTLEALLDALLPRIAPAAMLPGDVAIVEQEDGPLGVGAGALVVYVGPKFWGWHPDSDLFARIEPTGMPFRAAWRA